MLGTRWESMKLKRTTNDTLNSSLVLQSKQNGTYDAALHVNGQKVTSQCHRIHLTCIQKITLYASHQI